MHRGTDPAIVAHNLRIAAELRTILGALRDAGVSCIVLKGIPLMLRIGQGLDSRRLIDNDVLVHRSDARTAMNVLAELGYASFAGRQIEEDLAVNFEHPLLRRDPRGGPLICEIHWNAFPPILFPLVDEGELWRRPVQVDAFGTAVSVFAPALQLLHLASHAMQHELCEPRTLTTLGLAWTRWHGEVDPDELAELARRFGIERTLRYFLETVHELGLGPASPWQDGAPRARLAGGLVRPSRLLLSAEDRYPERYFRAMAMLTLVEPSVAAAYLLRRAVPPPKYAIRARGTAAVVAHYLARPFRPVLRGLGWSPR